MRFDTLADWLRWQENLHGAEIELGLDRVREVLNAAALSTRFDCPCIMVAGTNGKGSVAAFIEAIARAAGLRTGVYTSPHLFRYNERVRIDGQSVTDDALCRAFDRIDRARGDITLTYFEFGTLAALERLQRQPLDLVVLEVGLGGRLDAVNVVDADVAVITTIDLDHQDWLGDDREAIGAEKAGIFRSGTPAVCGERQPPQSLLRAAAELSCKLARLGVDFDHTGQGGRPGQGWRLRSDAGELQGLPPPALRGAFQYDNAATALRALQAVDGVVLTTEAVAKGLRGCHLPGRLQVVSEAPRIMADVAHNAQAARALADTLAGALAGRQADSLTTASVEAVRGRRYALLAMLADKEVEAVVAALRDQVDIWLLAGLEAVSRGLSGEALAARIRRAFPDLAMQVFADVPAACARLQSLMDASDRAIITGSFYTAGQGIEYFRQHPSGQTVHGRSCRQSPGQKDNAGII